MLNQKKKPSALVIFGSVLLGILFTVLVLFVGFNIWLNRNCFIVEVSGDSMLDTVENGDLLYVRDIEAHRGDIVIISVKNYEEESGFHFSGEFIIKRLIAVEGDTVKCENGVVSIQYAGSDEFVVLDEPYARGNTPALDYGTSITVEAGKIFFLGDNRENSYDSTELGCLQEKDIVGVVPPWSLKIKSFTTFREKLRGRMISGS